MYLKDIIRGENAYEKESIYIQLRRFEKKR